MKPRKFFLVDPCARKTSLEIENMDDGWCCCLSRRLVNAGFISRHTRLLDVPEVQLDTTHMGK